MMQTINTSLSTDGGERAIMRRNVIGDVGMRSCFQRRVHFGILLRASVPASAGRERGKIAAEELTVIKDRRLANQPEIGLIESPTEGRWHSDFLAQIGGVGSNVADAARLCRQTPAGKASKYMNLAQIRWSPQCGFTSAGEGNVLTEAARNGPQPSIISIHPRSPDDE